jgi:transposase
MTENTNQVISSWVGIDVAKNTFDVAVHPQWTPGEAPPLSSLPKASFPSGPDGVAAFLTWLDGRVPVDCARAVMEATGRYSLQLVDLLVEARPSLTPAIAEPRTVCHFTRSLGLRNKTDSADAAALSRFGAERCPQPWSRPAPEYAALREMVRQRTFLVESLVAARNRLAEVEAAEAVAELQREVVEGLQKALARINAIIRDHVAAQADLAEAVRRLSTIPGVAFVTATTILGELGDITRFGTSRSLSAFAGLSPRRYESGTSVRGRTRMCKQGGSRARQALYLATLAAVRGNSGNRLGRAYADLVDNGKPKMVAIGAVMRRMLVLMRALLVGGEDYRDDWPTAQRQPRA